MYGEPPQIHPDSQSFSWFSDLLFSPVLAGPGNAPEEEEERPFSGDC